MLHLLLCFLFVLFWWCRCLFHVFCYVCKTHLVLKYPAVCYCRSSLIVQTSVLAEFSESGSFSSHGVTVKPEKMFFTELSFAVFS